MTRERRRANAVHELHSALLRDIKYLDTRVNALRGEERSWGDKCRALQGRHAILTDQLTTLHQLCEQRKDLRNRLDKDVAKMRKEAKNDPPKGKMRCDAYRAAVIAKDALERENDALADLNQCLRVEINRRETKLHELAIEENLWDDGHPDGDEGEGVCILDARNRQINKVQAACLGVMERLRSHITRLFYDLGRGGVLNKHIMGHAIQEPDPRTAQELDPTTIQEPDWYTAGRALISLANSAIRPIAMATPPDVVEYPLLPEREKI